MARKSAAPKIPGNVLPEGEDTPAPAAPVAPAVARAVESADKMSYADAVKAASEGKLSGRVLTEKGWYIPDATREVA